MSGFVVFRLVASVPTYERLQNDLFYVDWDVKTLIQSVLVHLFPYVVTSLLGAYRHRASISCLHSDEWKVLDYSNALMPGSYSFCNCWLSSISI